MTVCNGGCGVVHIPLFCEYDQEVKHYPEKRGIVHNEILLPANAPPEYADRNTLWNAAEAVEKQWNSQLARRWVLTIPIVAIGVITKADIPEIMKTGVNGIALLLAALKILGFKFMVKTIYAIIMLSVFLALAQDLMISENVYGYGKLARPRCRGFIERLQVVQGREWCLGRAGHRAQWQMVYVLSYPWSWHRSAGS